MVEWLAAAAGRLHPLGIAALAALATIVLTLVVRMALGALLAGLDGPPRPIETVDVDDRPRTYVVTNDRYGRSELRSATATAVAEPENAAAEAALAVLSGTPAR